MTWNEGKPERPALYNCKVNGEETVLQLRYCPISGMKYWLYVDGSDVDPSAHVQWREGKIITK